MPKKLMVVRESSKLCFYGGPATYVFDRSSGQYVAGLVHYFSIWHKGVEKFNCLDHGIYYTKPDQMETAIEQELRRWR